MKKFKLKPCPFCGSTAVAFQEVGSYENGQPMWYRGVCQHCTAQSQMDGTKEKAVDRWNERSSSSDSSEDEAQKHVEAIQYTLKKVGAGEVDIMRTIDWGNIRMAAVALSHCILDRKNWIAISDIMNDKDKMRKEEERFASDLEFAKYVTHLTNQITDVFFAPPSINIDTNAGSKGGTRMRHIYTDEGILNFEPSAEPLKKLAVAIQETMADCTVSEVRLVCLEHAADLIYDYYIQNSMSGLGGSSLSKWWKEDQITKEGQALKALFKDFIDQGYVPGEFKMAAYDAACRVQFAQQMQRHS